MLPGFYFLFLLLVVQSSLLRFVAVSCVCVAAASHFSVFPPSRGAKRHTGSTSAHGRTPMFGSQTPMYGAGSRTPIYGSQTPMHDGETESQAAGVRVHSAVPETFGSGSGAASQREYLIVNTADCRKSWLAFKLSPVGMVTHIYLSV